MRSMFQQRHFEALAQLMQDVTPDPNTKAETRAEYRERIICGMCKLFMDDNVHFKEDRFRAACMPGANVRSRHPVQPQH